LSERERTFVKGAAMAKGTLVPLLALLAAAAALIVTV